MLQDNIKIKSYPLIWKNPIESQFRVCACIHLENVGPTELRVSNAVVWAQLRSQLRSSTPVATTYFLQPRVIKEWTSLPNEAVFEPSLRYNPFIHFSSFLASPYHSLLV